MKRTIYSLAALSLSLSSCCSQPSNLPSAEEVMSITKSVADWQVSTFAEQGRYRALPPKEECKPWHHRDRYHDLEWIPAAFYAGLYEFSEISEDGDRYRQWLCGIGSQHEWSLYERKFHADDHAVGMTYVKLAEHFNQDSMLMPTKLQFDDIMSGEKRDVWHWTWCDALFMAPPVWSELAKATGEIKYLEYMDEQYHKTYDVLWSEEEGLFYRDKSYFDQAERNGKGIFWARGNGWVFGGLAYAIPDMPEDWEGREFYIKLFQRMAQTLKQTQRQDGTWSAGLLGDEADYPNIETSGTSFFAFGLAWGLNNGLLDRATYEPVLMKAWHTLSAAVNEEGMLGYVQPVGAAPGLSFKEYTELYGSGAMLAAGTEMYRYVKQR